MSQIKKSLAEKDLGNNVGCALFILLLGGLCLIFPTIQLARRFTPDASQKGLNGWGWAGLTGGLVVSGLGIWFGLDSVYQGLAAKRDRLNQVFFKLLDENDGEITALQFAREAHLPGKEARTFLDGQARAFNATFNVDVDGGISYFFKQ